MIGIPYTRVSITHPENCGTLELAQIVAGHADSRTTKLYDRHRQRVLLEDTERIRYRKQPTLSSGAAPSFGQRVTAYKHEFRQEGLAFTKGLGILVPYFANHEYMSPKQQSGLSLAVPRSQSRTAAGQKALTPLWIISIFVTFTESVLGIALTQASGGIQVSLTVFVITFPVLIAAAFFFTLWYRPFVFYSPKEYENVDVEKFVGAMSRFTTVVKKAADLRDQTQIIGDPDQFRLLFKVSGQGWKKSTKALEVEHGCLVQVTTEQINPDSSLSIAEAVAFVPNVAIEDDANGDGRHLRPRDVQ